MLARSARRRPVDVSNAAPGAARRVLPSNGVWVRRAAIRPVPLYARVPAHVLTEIEAELADDDELAREQLDTAFTRFEQSQPALAARVAEALGRPLDETALALGYFLTLAVWLAFERNFEERLGEVTSDELEAAEQSLELDEELRRLDPAEAVDSDDVIAMEQPDVLGFVQEHLDTALEAHAGTVDVDDVDAIYRVVLVEVLALSYAVEAPAHHVLPKPEFSA
jgi:hypothetical protein